MKKRLVFPLVLLFGLACSVPGFAPPAAPLPTQPPGLLETAIAQTADAAQTQTAAVLPTSTFTPPPTRTPSITPSPTVTFIYRLYTSTPIPSETPVGFFTVESGGQTGGSSDEEEEEDGKRKRPVFTGKEWTCSQVGVFPPRNAEFKVKSRFTVYWTLMNTGTKTWTVNGVDFVYKGGYRHEGTKIQDFTVNVPTGAKATVSASFYAPRQPGTFQTIFTLMVGRRTFCGINYQFVVVE
ncbi:MAG: hypothetical protein DPW18_06850 [Chloroflexi bacterium]|nr:hypothetical protein [Chloroflexota bacterium]MDL1941573.1 hypothetical protein [Chloroflexi bacterium CFX2]